MPPVRRLAAILAADVAGYSRLMGADEEGTLERVNVFNSKTDVLVPLPGSAYYTFDIKRMRCRARPLTIRS
jgi:hypothetical protein